MWEQSFDTIVVASEHSIPNQCIYEMYLRWKRFYFKAHSKFKYTVKEWQNVNVSFLKLLFTENLDSFLKVE